MTAQRSTTGSIADLDLVVDADAHLSERAEQLIPYLEEPYASLFGAGEDGANVATPSYPKDELFRSLGGKVQWAEVDSAEDEREAMDRFGIDYVLLTPTLNLYLPIFSDERFAHALAKAYNDFVVSEFLEDGPDGFKAVLTLSPLAPRKAAEEAERLADHPDVVAALIGSTGVFPPLGDRRYDPIYDALDDHDLPLVLHGATGSFISAHPFIKRGLKSYWELHIVSHPFSQMIQLTSLIGRAFPSATPISRSSSRKPGWAGSPTRCTGWTTSTGNAARRCHCSNANRASTSKSSSTSRASRWPNPKTPSTSPG
jgi:predicted TIM-barrel fold metal-dependent hydrolase